MSVTGWGPDFAVGVPVEVAPSVRRLLAPNPSPMTGPGTNTYILGGADVAIVDPGPDDPAHIAAILAATGRAAISQILITHAHRDHSDAAPALAKATGARICGFGHATAGRSAAMQQMADAGLVGGGEGVDRRFQPDMLLRDGDGLGGTDWEVRVHHTPGHFAGHLAFSIGDAVLTGDTVLGWTSTLISPPDGDLGAFMATCSRLRASPAQAFLPGHGPVLDQPGDRLDWLIAHRLERGAQIAAALTRGPATAADLVRAIYTDIAPALRPMAERNVLAHLIDLYERNEVQAEPHLSSTARFSII